MIFTPTIHTYYAHLLFIPKLFASPHPASIGHLSSHLLFACRCTFLQILSLEMHCSTKQQRIIAELLIQHLGSSLLTYDELDAGGDATSRSPLGLKRRVLVKGKVKYPKLHRGRSKAKLTRRSKKKDLYHAAPKSCTIGSGTMEITIEPHRTGGGGVEDIGDAVCVPEVSDSLEPTESGAGKAAAAKGQVWTPPQLEALLALRGRAAHDFLQGVMTSALPITSMSEDKVRDATNYYLATPLQHSSHYRLHPLPSHTHNQLPPPLTTPPLPPPTTSPPTRLDLCHCPHLKFATKQAPTTRQLASPLFQPPSLRELRESAKC